MADTIVAQADVQYAQNDFEGQIKLLEAGIQAHPENAELLWRLARALYQDAHQKPDDKVEQKALLEKAYDVAQQVITVNEDHWGGHKWSGIILGSLGDFKASKDKIASAFTVKSFFLRAEDLAPDDATIQHALGKWCFTVANISWLERQSASVLIATPPTSSYEEALEHLNKCHQLAANNPAFQGVVTLNCFLIAQCYEGLKKFPEAKEWYQKCINAGGTTKPEEDSIETAKQKLATVGQSTGWLW